MKQQTAVYTGTKFAQRLAPTDPAPADQLDAANSSAAELQLFISLAKQNDWKQDYPTYLQFCDTNELQPVSEDEFTQLVAAEFVKTQMAIRKLQAQRRAALNPDPRRQRRS